MSSVNSDNIIDLFNFDRWLSSQFLSNVLNLECRINTIIFDEIFIFSIRNKKINGEDKDSIKCGQIFKLTSNALKEIFKNDFNKVLEAIDRLKFDNEIIKKYKDKKSVPVWFFSTQLNFGNIIKIFKCLNNEISKQVIKRLSLSCSLNGNENSFIKILELVKEIRNKMCHSNSIFIFDYKKDNDQIIDFMKSIIFIETEK